MAIYNKQPMAKIIIGKPHIIPAREGREVTQFYYDDSKVRIKSLTFWYWRPIAGSTREKRERWSTTNYGINNIKRARHSHVLPKGASLIAAVLEFRAINDDDLDWM